MITCPTGTMRLPVTPETSTVLGDRVTADSISWRGLDWRCVMPDHGPNAFQPEGGGYLHVGWAHPDDGCDLSWYEGVRYRVRCRHEVGQRLHVGERYAYVLSVEAEEAPGGWWWVVGYGARVAEGKSE